ncbi:MAG: Beta-glucosidase [Acidobacteria bacterium]|nr:Beta-glucosidase [Acidobacteriota bacterium]
MLKNRIAGALSLLGFLLVMPATPATQSALPTGAEARRRAEALLKQMTVDEKVGQLNQSSGIPMPALGVEDPEALIAQGKVGSILWLFDVGAINRLQRVAIERSRLHVPLLVAYDVIHGYRTSFPVPLAMASSWDPELVEAAQHLAAQDARAAGIHLTFAPMVDIARDARWGRMVEGAGEDPFLGAAMARAQVRGFQGEALGPESVLACVKHFAGYGAAEGGRDYDSAYIPEGLLRNVYLAPFHAALQAGAASVMSAYMNLDDVPATGNRWLLTDLLRKEWGFEGFVISDAFAVGNLVTHGFAADPEDAALKAIAAGTNMDMASLTYTKHLAGLVAKGAVSEARLDAMVRPILEAKYRMGLFENPYVDESKVDGVLNRAEGRALARKVAARSLVLLKNERGVLPLDKGVKKVAVIGPLADAARDIEGGWTVEGLFGGATRGNPVTVLAGIRSRLGAGAQVTHVAGPRPARAYISKIAAMMGAKPAPPLTEAEKADWLAKTRAAAADADAVVAVMGETYDMSAEAASRATLDLPGIQQEMLEAAVASGKPVVLVLENGRPLDIRWAAAHVPAILEAWFPGSEGGNAVADVLFGDVNPGGKLPVTWPLAAGQAPLYYNHDLTHEPDDRPDFTSRYWDLSSKPLYPFGHGLSYTSFAFANLRLRDPRITTEGATEAAVDVTNTGAVGGDAVAQLYVHQRAGSASRPVRELKGFRRVALKPGETRTVRFRLGKDELRYWSPAARQWVVEPGTFDVWAGGDSTAALHAELVVAR